MSLSPGTILQNRYRIVALLGQGGMGAVYRAWDTRLNIAVAFKEMIPQPGLEPAVLEGLRQQFQQEAVVLARLNHPHLVRVTDFFQEKGKAYLVMDFVKGESLAEKIGREGAQPEGQVVTWAEGLLDALAYCHSQGILHRDIKPHNVIIREDNHAVLVDFGLVKLWNPNDPHTRTVMRGMGTPEYAPPEQYDLQFGHTDARSDIYSVGATLYHALTGNVPPTATLRMARPGSFQPPRAIKRDISPHLEEAVTRAMALPIEERFPGAEAMAAALKQRERRRAAPRPTSSPPPPMAHTEVMPETQQPPARPTSPPPSSARPSSPTPTKKKKGLPTWAWLAGAGGLLLVVALVCISVFLLGDGDDNGDITPTDTPTLYATPLEADEGTGGDIVVENRSSFDLCYVFISSTDNTEWGADRLAEDEIIREGESRAFKVIAGTYDIKITDCDGTTLRTAWDLQPGSSVTVGGAGKVALLVLNESTSDICFTFISPVTAESWGEDWLGPREGINASGGRRAFFVDPGTYDLLVQDCEQNSLVEERGVELRDNTNWTITD
ncbi:MAG: serine/threonine protein kinase [Anaerolineae bacterium]